MNIHDRIKKVLSDSRLSLPDFAKQVGVSRNALIGYRDGQVSPQYDFLERVIEVFNLDPAWFLLGEERAAKARALDNKLLADIVFSMERSLKNHREELDPEKKGRLVAILYEYFYEAKKEVTKETVERYLKLVA